MEDDWDLHAVVRGCATIASTSSTTTTSSVSSSSSLIATTTPSYQPSCGFFSILPTEQSNQKVFSLCNNSNPFEARNSIEEELHELCKPFFLKSQPNFHSFQTSSSSSSLSYSSSPNSVQAQHKQQQQQHQQHSKHPHHAGSAATPRSLISIFS